MSLLLFLRGRVLSGLAALPRWGWRRTVVSRMPDRDVVTRMPVRTVEPMDIDLVEGWTAPVPLTLEEDGEAAVLTGLTIAASLYDRDGAAVEGTTAEITDAAAGEIEWDTDGVLTVAASPYELRFEITGADGDVYFPAFDPVKVVVRR